MIVNMNDGGGGSDDADADEAFDHDSKYVDDAMPLLCYRTYDCHDYDYDYYDYYYYYYYYYYYFF